MDKLAQGSDISWIPFPVFVRCGVDEGAVFEVKEDEDSLTQRNLYGYAYGYLRDWTIIDRTGVEYEVYDVVPAKRWMHKLKAVCWIFNPTIRLELSLRETGRGYTVGELGGLLLKNGRKNAEFFDFDARDDLFNKMLRGFEEAKDFKELATVLETLWGGRGNGFVLKSYALLNVAFWNFDRKFSFQANRRGDGKLTDLEEALIFFDEMALAKCGMNVVTPEGDSISLYSFGEGADIEVENLGRLDNYFLVMVPFDTARQLLCDLFRGRDGMEIGNERRKAAGWD